MSKEPENLVLEMLRGLRSEMASMKADLKGEMQSLRADVASDMVLMEARNAAEHKNTRDQINGLRRSVMEYHSTVIGHGILYSEREERVRRVEQHLNLPFKATGAH